MCVGGCCDRSGNKADKFILRNCLSNSDFQECLAYLKLPSSLTWSCQWTDGHGGLRDPRSSPLPHCRWEEVRRKLVGGGVLDSGRALVICQLLSEVGRLSALPGAISISCSLRCRPALSLEGGVMEGITGVGSSSYFAAS